MDWSLQNSFPPPGHNRGGGDAQMKKKVAVESQLSNVSEYLEHQGYEVMEFQHNQGISGQLANVDAVVITGMDQNYIGMHDIKTPAPVINASGLSPQQIGEMLEERLV